MIVFHALESNEKVTSSFHLYNNFLFFRIWELKLKKNGIDILNEYTTITQGFFVIVIKSCCHAKV